jgi:hypothetical protein
VTTTGSEAAPTGAPGTGAPAFKEWAVIVHALLAGEQILDVRKGGLREPGRHFGLQATRVWLYPTVEHQRAELLKPAYRRWLDGPDGAAAVPGVGSPIRIEGWADIVAVAELVEPDDLAKLDGKFVWTLDYAATRLKWKRRDPLHVLALRAHRLVEPITVEWRDEYGGCTSWVDLHGLPDDPATLPSEPALSDGAFEARLGFAAGDLPAGFSDPRTGEPLAR